MSYQLNSSDQLSQPQKYDYQCFVLMNTITLTITGCVFAMHILESNNLSEYGREELNFVTFGLSLIAIAFFILSLFAFFIHHLHSVFVQNLLMSLLIVTLAVGWIKTIFFTSFTKYEDHDP